jgi:hypothetical protein
MDLKLPLRPKRGATDSPIIIDGPEAYTLPGPDYLNIHLSPRNIAVENNTYIPLYGLFTGDIWHVAAAQILSEYEKDGSDMPFGRFQIITCISVNNYDRRLAADEEVAKDNERPATALQPPKRKITKSGQKRKTKARLDREEKAQKKAEETKRKEQEKEAKRRKPRRKSAPNNKKKNKKQDSEEEEIDEGAEGDEDSSGDEPRPRTPRPSVKQTKKRSREQEEKEPGKKLKLQDKDDNAPKWKAENAVAKRARSSWRYLTTIGLTTAVVLVRDGTGPVFWPHVHDYLTWDEVDAAYRRQGSGMIPQSFDDIVVGEMEAMGGIPPVIDYKVKHGPEREPQLVDLLCSTSAVMQLMKYLGVQQSQMILGYRLSGGSHRTRWVEEVATQKLQQLVEIIDEVYSVVDDVDLEGVLLFNYRLGDVNKQHDSNVDILEQVRRLAAEQKLATIIVPQMDNKEYQKLIVKLEDDEDENNENSYLRKYFHFDFLGLTVPNASWMDNRVKAYFWHLVAVFLQRGLPLDVDEDPPSFVKREHRCVHGFIGGRSGSTDLPAFVGLRGFSWEEPYLTAINTTLPQKEGEWNRRLYSFQGPQVLRLLNERAIMVTGFLDPTDMIYRRKKTGSDRIFKGIQERDNILQTWLKGPSEDADVIIPVLPRGVKATFAVSFPSPSKYISWRKSVMVDPFSSSSSMRVL